MRCPQPTPFSVAALVSLLLRFTWCPVSASHARLRASHKSLQHDAGCPEPCATTTYAPCKHWRELPPAVAQGKLYPKPPPLKEYTFCGERLNEAWAKERGTSKCSHEALQAAKNMEEVVCRCAQHPRWGKNYIASYRELVAQQHTWCGNASAPVECTTPAPSTTPCPTTTTPDPCANITKAMCVDTATTVLLWHNRDKKDESKACTCDLDAVDAVRTMEDDLECCKDTVVHKINQDIGYVTVETRYDEIFYKADEQLKDACPEFF